MSENAKQSTLWEWKGSRKVQEDPWVHSRGRLEVCDIPPMETPQMLERVRAAKLLHRQLEASLGCVHLRITNNRRRMLSFRQVKNALEVRVHHLFLCDIATMAPKLLSFIQGETAVQTELRAFIQARRNLLSAPAPGPLKTLGQYHDLDWLLQRARTLVHALGEEAAAPEGGAGVRITWGRHSKGRRSIRLGSFDFEQRLIRVHPALDERWVPSFFLEFVVYHELLHALYPPLESLVPHKARHIHHDTFRQMEQRFPRYQDALSWEAAHLHKLLHPPC